MILKVSATALFVALLSSSNMVYGQNCPEVLFGEQAFLMNKDASWLQDDGQSVSGNDIRIDDLIPEGPFLWRFRSSASMNDTEPRAGECVRYGDTFYLQNMDNGSFDQPKYLTTSEFGVTTHNPYSYNGTISNWKISSPYTVGVDDNQTTVGAGACVDYVEDIYILTVDGPGLLRTSEQFDDAVTQSLSDASPETFEWVIRSTRGDGSKNDKTECLEKVEMPQPWTHPWNLGSISTNNTEFNVGNGTWDESSSYNHIQIEATHGTADGVGYPDNSSGSIFYKFDIRKPGCIDAYTDGENIVSVNPMFSTFGYHLGETTVDLELFVKAWQGTDFDSIGSAAFKFCLQADIVIIDGQGTELVLQSKYYDFTVEFADLTFNVVVQNSGEDGFVFGDGESSGFKIPVLDVIVVAVVGLVAATLI